MQKAGLVDALEDNRAALQGARLRRSLICMHQLKASYGQRSGAFLANAVNIPVFNVEDVETAA